MWEKAYGYIYQDILEDVIPDRNGGFVLAGRSNSRGWLVKVDDAGNMIWDTIVTPPRGGFTSGYQASDGNFVLAGGFDSAPSGDLGIFKGKKDLRVLKIDPLATIIWDNIMGGDEDDEANDIIETADGGSLVVGSTRSSMNGDVGTTHGWADNWILKFNATGSLQWQKTFGSSESEWPFSVVPLHGGGGYLLAGITLGHDKDVLGTQGKADAWIYSIDELGNLGWQRSFGGSESDAVRSIVYADDGYYVAVGATESSDGDLLNAGNGLAWQFRFHPEN